MKRSVAIENIINVLRLTGNHYCDNGRDEQDAERILKRIEALGMFYCPVEDFGEFQLRTPKGWETEDE
jgi:hypothetical protein